MRTRQLVVVDGAGVVGERTRVGLVQRRGSRRWPRRPPRGRRGRRRRPRRSAADGCSTGAGRPRRRRSRWPTSRGSIPSAPCGRSSVPPPVPGSVWPTAPVSQNSWCCWVATAAAAWEMALAWLPTTRSMPLRCRTAMSPGTASAWSAASATSWMCRDPSDVVLVGPLGRQLAPHGPPGCPAGPGRRPAGRWSRSDAPTGSAPPRPRRRAAPGGRDRRHHATTPTATATARTGHLCVASSRVSRPVSFGRHVRTPPGG